MKSALLLRFIGLDVFGHPINLNYKGNETHNTFMGACLSLVVYACTLAIAITSLTEVIAMDDPQIKNYSRPLTPAEREALAPVSFDEHGFLFGIQVVGLDPKTEEITMRGIPPEIGQFVLQLEDAGEVRQEALVDCQELLPEDIEELGWVRKEVESGTVMCVRPEGVATGYFKDTQDGDHRAIVSFARCGSSSISTSSNVRCKSQSYVKRWLKENHVHLRYYSTDMQIDFSSTDDFIHQTFEAHPPDLFISSLKWFYMKQNVLEMYDSIYDPFGNETYETNYLTIHDSYHIEETEETEELTYRIHFDVQPSQQVITRTRYSFWDALGDIGGLHDGIVLLFGLFMSSVSSRAFEKDIEQSEVTETALSSGEQTAKVRLAKALKDVNQPVVIQGQYLTSLVTYTGQLFQKDRAIKSFLSCCRRKPRPEVEVDYAKHLDIQNIISNAFTLTEFMRAFLTRPQKLLLAIQKSRKVQFKRPGSDGSDAEVNPNAVQVDIVQEILADYQPQTPFERKLLLGVLFDKGAIPEEVLQSRQAPPSPNLRFRRRAKMQVPETEMPSRRPLEGDLQNSASQLRAYQTDTSNLSDLKYDLE